MGEKAVSTSKLIWLGVLQMLASVAEYAFDLVQNDLFTWALLGSGAATIVARVLMGLFMPGVDVLRIRPENREGAARGSALLVLGLVAIACASLVTVASGGKPELQPRLFVRPSVSDSTSLDVRLRWQASRAQRGATVDHYEGAVLVNGVIAGTFETQALEAVVTIERPLPGETVQIVGRVHAVDSRGIAGDVAESEPFTYHEPAAGPTAPGPIEIDTLDVGEIGMRYDSVRIVAPSAEVDEDGVIRMVVGESIAICGIGFAGDRAYVMRNEELEWSSSNPAVLELNMTPGVPPECMPLGAQGGRLFTPFRGLAVLSE